MSKIEVANNDRKNFTIIPNYVVRGDHSMSAKGVLLIIASYAGNNGRCFASLETIAKACNIGRRTVIRAIKYWEGKGEIEVLRTKGEVNKIVTTFDYTRPQETTSVPGVTGAMGDTTTSVPGVTPPVSLVSPIRRTTKKNKEEDAAVKPRSEENEATEKLFELFQKTINPSISYGNTTQRKAAVWLIGKFGLELVLAMARSAISVQGEEYAPTITNPYELKEKLARLKAFFERAKRGSGIIKIS